MTSISAASSYNPYAALTNSAGSKTSSSTSGNAGTLAPQTATTVTLSDAAKAALDQADWTKLIADTRTALDALLTKDPDPAKADLSKLDRRQLYAISSNANGKFTADEQAAAKTEQQARFDTALAGPLAVARVTDDVDGIYKAALDYLDAAPNEEKATSTWTAQRDALLEARKELAADPSTTPQVDGDIVADFIKRSTAGETAESRSFADVASDARAALDKQYADAKAAKTELVFSTGRKGQLVDYSDFDSRSLSAIALNQGNQFSAEEVFTAKQEMHHRSSATALAALNSAKGNPGTLATNIISAYASMSPEERAAAGWTDKLYAAAVSSYKTVSQLSGLFNAAGTSGSSTALSLLNSASASNPTLSLLGGGSSGASGSNSAAMSLVNYLDD